MLRENSGHAAPPAGGHDGQRTEPLTHFSRNNMMSYIVSRILVVDCLAWILHAIFSNQPLGVSPGLWMSREPWLTPKRLMQYPG